MPLETVLPVPPRECAFITQSHALAPAKSSALSTCIFVLTAQLHSNVGSEFADFNGPLSADLFSEEANAHSPCRNNQADRSVQTLSPIQQRQANCTNRQSIHEAKSKIIGPRLLAVSPGIVVRRSGPYFQSYRVPNTNQRENSACSWGCVRQPPRDMILACSEREHGRRRAKKK
jgi:hypothetical protein